MEEFNAGGLLLRAAKLPAWKQVMFMVYCCERMIPNYRCFSLESNFGDEQTLRQALDGVWAWIETDDLPTDIADIVAACEHQAPDTEMFSSDYTSAALDVAAAIAITASATAIFRSKNLLDVASLSRDTVDVFVQLRSGLDANDPSLEETILGSGLMQNELCFQRESLELLSAVTGERASVALGLRPMWSNIAIGSTGCSTR